MPREPIIMPGKGRRTGGQGPIATSGWSVAVHEWAVNGPASLHGRHMDDEAWHATTRGTRLDAHGLPS